MNTITRRITVVGIGLVAAAAIGGSASGAGAAGGGAVTCRTWDPHVIVTVDEHRLHPIVPDGTEDPWNPAVDGESGGQDPWSPAVHGDGRRQDPWHPATPTGDQDAWHPDDRGADAC